MKLYLFCWFLFILAGAEFLHLSSVQWICLVFCWFLFILAGTEFLRLSSVQWIWVYWATEQSAEFLHPIGIHRLISIVFAELYSFYQAQYLCILVCIVFRWFLFILAGTEFLRVSSVQWICIVFWWFLFILAGAQFLRLSSVQWIWVY